MYIIAGLGNPGKKYTGTRHNMGFEALDAVAAKYNIDIKKSKFNALYGEGTIEGEKVVLIKPQTFMNLSGEAVREFKNWYKTDTSQIIIIYDDVSLPVGKMRIRKKGSAGGHNGMKSIIYQLNSDEFPRIKLGVGSPENPEFDLADYVLGKFTKDEVKILIQTAINTADAVGEIIKNGCEKAMSKFN
ncbi:MAG: aminoacyl-tRNA hydrolase [Clostridia bacterium]|nr:aminoacyl-tRNA hydrolase [Clostridia bacterium]